LICDATSVEVSGVDYDSQLQSAPQTYDVSGGADVETGVLTACDELDEFFYYSLNGGENIHTIEAYAQTGMDSTQTGEVLFISGLLENNGQTGIPTISVDADSPGTYNPIYIVLFDPSNPNSVVVCEDCSTLEVIITEFGAVGELLRGTISGTVESGGGTFTIEGAFKIIIDN
jgi:hypothetical protein